MSTLEFSFSKNHVEVSTIFFSPAMSRNAVLTPLLTSSNIKVTVILFWSSKKIISLEKTEVKKSIVERKKWANMGQILWLIPSTPALVGQWQANLWVWAQPGLNKEFQAIYGYMVRSCLKQKKKGKDHQHWWDIFSKTYKQKAIWNGGSLSMSLLVVI